MCATFLTSVRSSAPQFRRGTGENIENDQFLFGHVFAHMALLLVIEVAAQPQQFLEKLFDIAAPRVVGLDEFLEGLLKVHARFVQTDQPFQLPSNGFVSFSIRFTLLTAGGKTALLHYQKTLQSGPSKETLQLQTLLIPQHHALT